MELKEGRVSSRVQEKDVVSPEMDGLGTEVSGQSERPPPLGRDSPGVGPRRRFRTETVQSLSGTFS